MLTTAIYNFVKGSMGQKFVESPPLDLEVCYGDSSATSPLIFVLSPGSDPMSMLLKFAERLKCQVRQACDFPAWALTQQRSPVYEALNASAYTVREHTSAHLHAGSTSDCRSIHGFELIS
jgi:hypothetical protein